jgi:hypothetical protein
LDVAHHDRNAWDVSSGVLSRQNAPSAQWTAMNSSSTRMPRALGMEIATSIACASQLPSSSTLNARNFLPA